MSENSYIQSDYFKKASNLLNDVYLKEVQKFGYPKRQYTDKGDEFFSQLWEYIDSSKKYCWILTYAMDSSQVANITFRKLINASKRGVDVVLFVDDLQNYTNKRMVEKLQNAGGNFVSLNPTWRKFWQIPTQEFFRRHHEKLVVIDDQSIIGSANIEASYGGPKIGSQTFYDLNLFAKGNVNVKIFKDHFIGTANLYGIQMKSHPEQEAKALPPYFKFLRTYQPNLKELQMHILNSIIGAEKKIVMIQPYYYPVRVFEQEILKAMQRGIQVELITSAKRDQPVYHYLKNYLLFRNINHPNLQLYEYPEQLLHMKGYFIDDQTFNIGSFNNDRWSWKLNNEANIFINDKEEAKDVSKVIERCKEFSNPVLPLGSIGPWRYIKIQFWQLFLYLSEIQMSKNKYFHLDKYQYKRIPQEWDESLGNDF